MRPDVPIYDFGQTLPATVQVGDKALDINVKRMAKSEYEEFEKTFKALFAAPRGVVDAEAFKEESERKSEQLIQFTEQSIRDYITVDEGWIRDRGEWVTTGEGLIAIFHARSDVLGAFMREIFRQNRLTDTVRKNSNSPRASVPGSPASIEARDGDRPEPIAEPAASSSTASSAAATDATSETAADAPASSGVPEAVAAH